MKIQGENKMLHYLKNVITNMPTGWLSTTTHRLDIYDEKLAKTQFLDQFETLFEDNNFSSSALHELPTAYDYIRLGHPLSCVLEWSIAHLNNLKQENVISFSSKTMPILAILRKNLAENTASQIVYTDELPACFDAETIRSVYGYNFSVQKIENTDAIPAFSGSTIFISSSDEIDTVDLPSEIDFYISLHSHLGSVLLVNGTKNENYISDIQHVRRRETIAMTPANSLLAIQALIEQHAIGSVKIDRQEDKASTLASISTITNAHSEALVASSGLSMQYAIMMGLIDYSNENHAGKAIKFIVPTNCYGGTNDQARRVADCIGHAEIVDLAVDGENDMVTSIDAVLAKIAHEDAIPYIIAEIPTNPRVEVPDMQKLKDALAKERTTASGATAIDPVFILDQTFCPNIHFLGEGDILASVRTISYASGSKFPSGGRCTAGYAVANKKADALMAKIERHLILCDNEATNLQYEILAEQLPSMNQRVADAYTNTRAFVDFIHETLPSAKINFVSEELATEGFTPSVFSLDLPTKGDNAEEKEAYKRELNHKLIGMMITQIPAESKYCVSYGQLKGVYWTIPATSTQGTTKEGDKDYIARVSLSGNMDLEKHKEVFKEFVEEI
jgi:cystathionine beta-lyase/cystathionine gamma-synthase